MKKLSQSLLMFSVFAALAMPAAVGAQMLTPHAPGGLKPNVYWLPEFKAAEAGGSLASGAYAAPQANWRLGLALAPRWDLQIGLAPSVSLTGGSQDRLARQRQALFGADALYLFGASDLRPFLLVGLGAQRELRGVDGAGMRLPDRSTPFVNAGVGLQYRWSNALGLQADIRRVQGFGRDATVGVGLRGPENTVNFGLTWSFGGSN